MCRKKLEKYVCLFVSALVLTQGCGSEETVSLLPTSTTKEYKADMPVYKDSNEKSVNTVDKGMSELYYSYHVLDDESQVIYMEIYSTLVSMKSNVKLSTTDKNLVDKIFSCVMNDHPEFFYVDGYSYVEKSSKDKVKALLFSGNYTMEQEKADQLKAFMDKSIVEIYKQIPGYKDEYDIVKYTYEWIIENTDYDISAANNQNICSVLLNGKSVCQGYAKTLQYMLQKLGIQSFIVNGYAGSEKHAWNLIRVDGSYYYIDATWGDASYTYGFDIGDNSIYGPSINYDYFLVTTDEICRTHTIENVVELPECIAVDDNYFEREGLYFSKYDEDTLKTLLNDMVANHDYLTIKCADGTYETMVQKLIGEKQVYSLIDNSEVNLVYTTSTEQRTITFWEE
jgi:hypothetical protein